MANVIMSHKVKDFDSWLSAFDADKARREGEDMKELGIYRTQDNGNEFMIMFEVQDVSKFRSMMDSPELKETMQEAGVLEPPQIWVTNKFR